MNIASKILCEPTLTKQSKLWKSKGHTLIFTNGCFDILHLGHIEYLEKAKSLGDVLVVGLNSDASVRRLKGPTRPLNPAYVRAKMLAALVFVDAVVVFEEDTPYELIKKVQPDVLIKGADYKIEDIVGADFVIQNGGVVKTIEFVKGFSTTKLIARVKQLS
ncbi:MAG: D-glycero-beta-D-manno-heptose 1-phosphate adenylyltransferase [Cytophagales bacterium]|nr:D-glycero-beta-D-manno-heptose 1-phosphate adenylyltransferase [Cytophagales bacterium]